MKQRRIAVRGIIFKNGKLLAQQLLPGSNGIARDYWCTPGGGLEEGESLHEGLVRELVEETGITPKIGKLLFVQQYGEGDREFLEFFFHIENARDYTVIDLKATTHGLIEIALVDFINPSQHTILPAFLQSIDLHGYLASEKPVFIYNELDS